MIPSVVLTLSGAFIGLRTEPARDDFLDGFFIKNEAATRYFKTLFKSHVRARKIGDQIPKATIFLASYLGYLLAALAYDQSCLILDCDDRTALDFALSTNVNKRVFLSKTSGIGSEDLPQTGSIVTESEILQVIPPGTVQHVVSIDSWRHETLLRAGLLSRLAPKALLTTIVHEEGLARLRSGAMTRDHFHEETSLTLDVTDYPGPQQRTLAVGLFASNETAGR